MTATEELRRLLNERDVEWKSFEGDPLGFVKAETAWGEVDELGNYTYWVTEYFDGTTLLNIGNPTPEQAVDAMLGRETCEILGYDDGYDEGLDGEMYQYADPRYFLSCEHEAYGSVAPNYCPVCGRKVVDE